MLRLITLCVGEVVERVPSAFVNALGTNRRYVGEDLLEPLLPPQIGFKAQHRTLRDLSRIPAELPDPLIPPVHPRLPDPPSGLLLLLGPPIGPRAADP